MMEAVGAVKLLINVAMKAKQFHKFYGKRDGELKTFAECASVACSPALPR